MGVRSPGREKGRGEMLKEQGGRELSHIPAGNEETLEGTQIEE